MSSEEDLRAKLDSGWRVLPPNPLYEREWVCSLDQGRAVLNITAPGGVISPEAARDVLRWLGVIVPVLERKATGDVSVTREGGSEK